MKRDQPRQRHEARPNTIGANDDISPYVSGSQSSFDTDFRVFAELGKLTPAEDEGRDATNKAITAVRV
jgi:hypothetical protein